MSDEIKVDRQPAVFVTIELHKTGTLDPMVVAELIGEELLSMQSKGIEISSVNLVRGISGTPSESDDDE